MKCLKFDRDKLDVKRLSVRKNKVNIEKDHIPVDQPPGDLSERGERLIETTVGRIRKARELGRSVMLTFGAHTIKNGMAPTLTGSLHSRENRARMCAKMSTSDNSEFGTTPGFSSIWHCLWALSKDWGMANQLGK
jgi:hypothetical protein